MTSLTASLRPSISASLRHTMAGAGEAGGVQYLHDIEPSTVMDLDATIEDSYPGTGNTWANLTPSPADGAAQTDYDFSLINSPTFTGTAGDAGAYFSHDGTNYFELAAGTNPTLFADMPKTSAGNSWWFAATFRTGADVSSGAFYIFDTRFGSGADIGVGILWSNAANNIQVSQRQSGTAGTTFNLTGSALANSTDYILAVSYDKDTDTIRYWLNATTNSNVSASFKTGTANAANTPTIGSAHGIIDYHSGMRSYGYYAGNTYLDDTKATAIMEHLQSRHEEGRYPFL